MDKLTMAHEYFMKHGRNNSWMESDVIDAWKYADAMQAEADKRNNKETCDKNIGLDSSVLKPSNSMELEWQPDWSQAPDAFEAGQQSQQAKIEELQKRIDEALKLVQKDCIEYGVSDFLEKAMDILKGK